MLRTIRYTRAIVGAAIAMAILSGCGGGGSTKKDPPATSASSRSLPIDSAARPEPGTQTKSGGVVVWVGHTPIYRSQLDRRLAIEVHAESPAERFLPQPPAFTSCIARLAALTKHKAGGVPSRTQLKAQCRVRYQKLLQATLDPVIASTWAIDEAAEQQLKLTDQDARTRLEQLKATQFGSEAKFHEFLRQAQENTSDLLFNIKGQLAYRAIFDQVRASVGRVNTAFAANYYASHRKQFAVSERRNLGLIHTVTARDALHAKKELESGASFASVVKRYKTHQPVFSKEGLLSGLEPHTYSEKALNDAFFTAPLNRVSGPIRIDREHGVHFRNPNDIRNIDGYYVFKITKISRQYQKPFSQVKAELMRELPETLYKQAVRAFAGKYRTKWIARTDCRPGYVVRKCRQFKLAPGEPAEDPYTLN